jgi:hypothetical protein
MLMWNGQGYDSETERTARGWAYFNAEGSTRAHMERVLSCPDRYTGWSFAWRALVLFVLFALPAGLLVLSLAYHAINAVRGL